MENDMNTHIEALKSQVESGLLSSVLPVGRFSFRAFHDMAQIMFDSHEKNYSDRTRIGQFFKLSPKPVVRYSLNVAVTRTKLGAGVVFSWKEGIKPVDALVIEEKILSLYTL